MRLPKFTRSLTLALSAAVLAATPMIPVQGQNNSNDGIDRWVMVRNYSSQDIMNIYYGRMNSNYYYSRDLLGTQVLRSGNQIRIKFDDGNGICTFDLKAVGEYGGTWTIRMNVCQKSGWNLYDD